MGYTGLFFLFFSLVISLVFQPALANTEQSKVLRIYHDADYSNHEESARSMKMGLMTALDEINNNLQGYKIDVIEKNHRGNSIRSKLHMTQFLKDPDALFILGGLHSPPYIQHRNFINENKILLAVPWAAGGPITRYDQGTNWVFRLSIDDTKAGYRIAQYALKEKQCKKPHMLLENTPWGKSNFKTMSKALEESNQLPNATFFEWNTQKNKAQITLRNIINRGSDCLLFVGNSVEGEVFAKAMLAQEKTIPIISHWGITGGDFHEKITSRQREQLDLNFIQSCFSFVSSPQTDFSKNVGQRAVSLFADIQTPKDIPAPTGFIHAYDLTRLIITATTQINITGDISNDRQKLHHALENIQQPVQGLIKTYSKPFSPWSRDNSDAHEALNLKDFCMGQFDSTNKIILH